MGHVPGRAALVGSLAAGATGTRAGAEGAEAGGGMLEGTKGAADAERRELTPAGKSVDAPAARELGFCFLGGIADG